MYNNDDELAEIALVGCMLLDSDVFWRYDYLPSKYFCSDSAELVYEAIKTITDRGGKVDADSVWEQLLDDGTEIFVDLEAVKNAVPTAANADYYAKIVIKGMFASLMEELKSDNRGILMADLFRARGKAQ